MKTDKILLETYKDISNFQRKIRSFFHYHVPKNFKICNNPHVSGTFLIEEEIIQWINIIFHDLSSIFFFSTFSLILSPTELHLQYTH